MINFMTWKTFLLYGLDLMTKDECAATCFFIGCNQIRYDGGIYDEKAQVVAAKTLWPGADELEVCLKNPLRFREVLDNIASSPHASLGKILSMTLCLPCVFFVPDIPRNQDLVYVMQEYFYDKFGVGSLWFDGMIYQGERHEFQQVDEKVRATLKEHLKKSNQSVLKTQVVSGTLYRDTRLNHLNGMSEGYMRKYLKKNYNTDTDGMDGSTVYGLMLDLFVDETGGPATDAITDAVRMKYREERKKRK